ncbi:hypothetical protein GQ42DRAFT_169151 [Ramicandelaber brevisporus]|nr:hypothetical protein GQ42DRAFT_169151 [Ramicandelaber brevisporus]
MPPNSTIAAIAESRGVSAEIGLCILDNANNKCTIMQFSDSSAYVRTVYHLHLFSVSILLLRAGLGTQSRLVANVSQMLPDIRIRTCPRAAFSDTASIEVLDHLCLPGTNSMVKQLLRSKWYALSAVAAVFHFLENDTAPAVTFPPQSIDFIVESCEGVAFIDSKSVSNLQLRQLYHKRGPSATLFDTINYTQTPMGARLLKVSILQPLASVSAISQRLDVVEWLVSHPQIHNRIQRILCRYSSTRDMDALITQVLKCDLHRNKDPVKRAHSVIRGAIDLYQSILGFELLAAIHAGLSSDGIQRTMAVLNKVIAPEAISTLSGRHSILFATKSGANGLLDAARTVYKELVDDVYALFDKYQDSYPELCLRLTYTAARGFGVELCSENGTFPTLPAVFIRARASKGSKKLLLTTLDLVKLNERLSRAMAEIEVLSGVVFEECVQFIHANASDLYRASESLALLDMLAGFASYCRQFDTTRPDFAVTLAIQQGYHPILLDNSKRTAHCKDGSMATSEHTPVIANDVYACHGRNLQMITGANMAGKTTYICQVALLSIMAQVGVPVPAMAASFPVFDRFLARLSHEDSLKLNTSTFMVEIIDTLYILRNSHDSSRSAGCGDVSALVLIDELGRGTAPTDGRALAFTACERLAQLPVFAFVTTHFADVALALERASHINDDDDDGDDDGVDDFEEHRLSEGLLNVNSHYGIRLAQQLGLPDSVISRALSVARAFDNIDDGGGSATATATTTTDLHSPIFDGAENTNEEKFIHVRNAERLIHLACAAVDPKIAIAGAAALGTATAHKNRL